MTMKYKSILFEPWVGKDYTTGGVFNKKVLVLGESHYCHDLDSGKCKKCDKVNMRSECFSQTQDVIGDFVNNYSGEPYQQTFLCFERALAGRELTKNEREKLWNSVIFYNFFQADTTGARVSPNLDAIQISEEAFRELLELYQPDVIIVWGSRLYEFLPAWEGTESSLTIGTDSARVWHYKVNGKEIPALCVHHPSSPSGKCWPSWHEFHKEFIGVPVL